MKKILTLCLAGLAGIVLAAELPVKCVSHRGEEWDAPEASRPAFELAMRRHADVMKLDIRFTKDGEVVLSHDAALTRTMKWDVKVCDVTLAELRAKGVFAEVGGYRNERIVTLREGLEIVRNCPEFWIDTKDFSPESFERALAEFDRAGIAHDRIMIATFTRNALRYVKVKHPELRRVLHVYVKKLPDGQQPNSETRAKLLAKLLQWRDEFGLFGLNLPARAFDDQRLTEQELRKLRAEGLWCSIWYVNDEAVARRFNRLGADAFVTGGIEKVRPGCHRPETAGSGK